MLEHDASTVMRDWIEGVCIELAMSEADRRECVVDRVIVLGDVPILFSEAIAGKQSHVIVRAVIGEAPASSNEREMFYELALRAQLMLCGPFTPVIGMDADSRGLLLSQFLDTEDVGAKDAVTVLRSVQEMVRHWREALKHCRAVSAGADS